MSFRGSSGEQGRGGGGGCVLVVAVGQPAGVGVVGAADGGPGGGGVQSGCSFVIIN